MNMFPSELLEQQMLPFDGILFVLFFHFLSSYLLVHLIFRLTT